MATSNVVRFRVKPGHDTAFLDGGGGPKPLMPSLH
jgi:hypothetical protein